MTLPKRALRSRIKELLEAIPRDVLALRSSAVWKRLFELTEYRSADVILIYLPLPTEIDTQPLAIQAWGDGKRVPAPRVTWDQRRMLPIEITSLTGKFEEDMYGIREPLEGLPVPIADLDLVLVPGLGFDTHGNRLGRGRGFYDRFLSHPEFRGVSCGVALEEQVVDSIPTIPTDIRMNLLITDEQVRRFPPA